MIEAFEKYLTSIWNLIEAVPVSLTDPEIKEGRAIIVTFSVAILLSIIGYIANRRRDTVQHRNEHSANFYSLNPQLVRFGNKKKLHSIIITAFKNRRYMTKAELKKYRKTLEKEMNRFEGVAVGASVGYISEKYVTRMEHSRLVNLFCYSASVIADTRFDNANPQALVYYERLFLRTLFPEIRYLVIPLEWMYGKPLFQVSYYVFRAMYFSHFILYWGVDFFPKGQLRNLTNNHLDCNWKVLRTRVTRTYLVIGGAIATSLTMHQFLPMHP